MVSCIRGEQLSLLKQKLSLPYVYRLLSYFKFIFSDFILLIISTASDFATRTSETELETFQCGAYWEAQSWYDDYCSCRHLKFNRCRKNPSQGFPYLTKNSKFQKMRLPYIILRRETKSEPIINLWGERLVCTANSPKNPLGFPKETYLFLI